MDTLRCSNSNDCLILSDVFPPRSFSDGDDVSVTSFLSDSAHRRRFMKRCENPIFNAQLRASLSCDDIWLDLEKRVELVTRSIPPSPKDVVDASEDKEPLYETIEDTPCFSDASVERSESDSLSGMSNLSSESLPFSIHESTPTNASTSTPRPSEEQKKDIIIVYNDKTSKKLSVSLRGCLQSFSSAVIEAHPVILHDDPFRVIFSPAIISQCSQAKLLLCVLKVKKTFSSCFESLNSQIRQLLPPVSSVVSHMCCVLVLPHERFHVDYANASETPQDASSALRSWLLASLADTGVPCSSLGSLSLRELSCYPSEHSKSLSLSPRRQRTYNLAKMRRSLLLEDVSQCDLEGSVLSSSGTTDSGFSTLCKQMSNAWKEPPKDKSPTLAPSKVVVFYSSSCKTFSSYLINFLLSQGFPACKFTEFSRNNSCVGKSSRRFSLSSLLTHYSDSQATFDALSACVRKNHLAVLLSADAQEFFHQRFLKTLLDLQGAGRLESSLWRPDRKLVVLSANPDIECDPFLQPLLCLRLESLTDVSSFRRHCCQILVGLLKYEAAFRCYATLK